MVEGLEKFKQQMDALCNEDLYQPTARAISIVQEAAKGNVRVRTGELRGSIYTDVNRTEVGMEGICYTNKAYAMYVEFGTGPKGEANHAGISPNVAVAYRQSGWMIPASAMSEDEARSYHFPIVKDTEGNVIGYYTRGQPARPYLYPALADNEDKILKEYEKYLKNKIGDVAK